MEGAGSRSHLSVSLIACLGVLQFVVLLGAAILLYPGGTLTDRTTVGYSLSGNYLSDLGRIEAWSGVRNSSRIPFTFAMCGLGISLAPLLVMFPRTRERGHLAVVLSGFSACAGLIGLGLTPYDRYFGMHHVFLVFFLASMLAMLVACWIGQQKEDNLWFTGGTLVLGGTIVSYALAGSHSRFIVTQKLTAGLAVVWILVVVWRVATFTVESIYVSRSRLKAEQQANRYMKSLERDYRRH